MAIVIGIAIAFVLIYGRANFWTLMAGLPDQSRIVFATLELKPSPNQYLVCRPEMCAAAEPHRVPSVYAVPAATVRRALREVIRSTEGVDFLQVGEIRIAASESENDYTQTQNTLRAVVRSPVMQFPDLISIDVVELSASRSTILVYSRSQLGWSDMNKNQQRVDRWLTDLAARLPVAEKN